MLWQLPNAYRWITASSGAAKYVPGALHNGLCFWLPVSCRGFSGRVIGLLFASAVKLTVILEADIKVAVEELGTSGINPVPTWLVMGLPKCCRNIWSAGLGNESYNHMTTSNQEIESARPRPVRSIVGINRRLLHDMFLLYSQHLSFCDPKPVL